jgi:hypothetical protein
MNADAQRRASDRGVQAPLVASTFALSWLGMMVVHEARHVLVIWTLLCLLGLIVVELVASVL